MRSRTPLIWPPTPASQQQLANDSDSLRVRGTKQKPSAPVDLIVTSQDLKIVANWTRPSDRSSPVVGYRVYTDTENTLFAHIKDPDTTHVEIASTNGTVRNVFVSSVNALGTESGLVSQQGTAGPMKTSELLPPNPLVNSTNNATVDSIDAGTSATVRIYGPGGVGSGYDRFTGFSTMPRPSGTIAGLAYSTGYYVMWTGTGFNASLHYSESLPDGWELVGTPTTVASGGSGGTGGGGGGNGGSGGGRGGCVEDGTPVEYPRGTESVNEEKLPCNEWVMIQASGCEPVSMHPATLVAIWRRAEALKLGDLLDIGDNGEFAMLTEKEEFHRPGTKIKRKVEPIHTYRARGYKLHNNKPD